VAEQSGSGKYGTDHRRLAPMTDVTNVESVGRECSKQESFLQTTSFGIIGVILEGTGIWTPLFGVGGRTPHFISRLTLSQIFCLVPLTFQIKITPLFGILDLYLVSLYDTVSLFVGYERRLYQLLQRSQRIYRQRRVFRLHDEKCLESLGLKTDIFDVST